MLRPGNAVANKVGDRLHLPDSAVAATPPVFQGGHHRGEDPQLARRQRTARVDSAEYTDKFVERCRERNVAFSLVARSCRQIHAAMFLTLDDESRKQPAVR